MDGLHNSVQFVGGFSHGEHLLNGSLTLGTDGFVLGNLSSLFLNERLMVGLTLQTVGEGGFDISFLGLGVLLSLLVDGNIGLAKVPAQHSEAGFAYLDHHAKFLLDQESRGIWL